MNVKMVDSVRKTGRVIPLPVPVLLALQAQCVRCPLMQVSVTMLTIHVRYVDILMWFLVFSLFLFLFSEIVEATSALQVKSNFIFLKVIKFICPGFWKRSSFVKLLSIN